VDTAGWEDPNELTKNKGKKKEGTLNKELLELMIQQTRTALIYSDLALFLIDSRTGVTENDILLSQWLHTRLRLGKNVGVTVENQAKTLEERQQEFEKLVSEGKELIPGTNLLKVSRKKLNRKFKELEQKSKEIQGLALLENADDIKVPTTLLVANKAEDGFFGEIEQQYEKLNIGKPIFISGEHGDGLVDLFQAIEKEMPENYQKDWESRMKKRVKRHEDYKRKLALEIEDLLSNKKDDENNEVVIPKKELEFDAKMWEKEFDAKNLYPEYNSDYDSDSEVNPLTRLFVPKIPGAQGQKKVTSENPMKRRKIQFSVAGRPNVGKSTLVNSLLQNNRVIASDIPGTTRDAVSVEWEYKGRRITLVDTAGIRPKVRLRTQLEQKIQKDTEKAIDYSHIVAVVIDGRNGLRTQDMAIISKVFDEGKALVLVANKWDLVPDKMKARLQQRIEKLQLTRGGVCLQSAIVVYTSALTGFNVNMVMSGVMKAYEKWNTRVSTSLLNKWLDEVKRVHKMPNEGKKHLKLRYIMQISVRPPTFYLFVNDSRLCPDSFERFIANALGREYKLRGVPIRILVRDRRGEGKYGGSQASEATRKVRERIKLYKSLQRHPTRKRRIVGSKTLYGKNQSIPY